MDYDRAAELQKAIGRVEAAIQAQSPHLEEDLLGLVVQFAAEYFEECPQDFCLQLLDVAVLCFGSTNRIVWSVRHGFRISREHCTSAFVEHFDRMHA